MANQSYYFLFFRISDDYTKAKQETGGTIIRTGHLAQDTVPGDQRKIKFSDYFRARRSRRRIRLFVSNTQEAAEYSSQLKKKTENTYVVYKKRPTRTKDLQFGFIRKSFMGSALPMLIQFKSFYESLVGCVTDAYVTL